MKTGTLQYKNSIQAIAYPAKADIAIKIALFAAIITCVNLMAFL